MKKPLFYILIASIIFFIVSIILLSNFSFLGHSPLSKEEVISDLPFFVIFSLLFGVIIYFKNDDFGKDKNNMKGSGQGTSGSERGGLGK